MKIELQVPYEIRCQLVFRQELEGPFEVREREDVGFVLIGTFGDGIGNVDLLRRRFGWAGTLKALAKLATPARRLYGMVKEGELAHWAWVTLKPCKHYWTDPGAVTIGPIETAVEWRRKGLAADAMRHAMNRLFSEGLTLFFIDTSNENVASQRTIAKCGFGAPVACYRTGA